MSRFLGFIAAASILVAGATSASAMQTAGQKTRSDVSSARASVVTTRSTARPYTSQEMQLADRLSGNINNN